VRFAGSLETGLLAFLHSGIAAEEAMLLESGAHRHVGDDQGAVAMKQLGAVIGADLWKLWQIPIGASVQFAESTLGEAHAARRALQQYERGIDAAIASAAHG